jgi:methyltransferase (TIGR00027 family)
MEELRASRTAQGAAMHRAAHQLLDRPLVFRDPLALGIIGSEAEAEVRGGTDPLRSCDSAAGGHGLAARGLRAFIVARSRLTEDILALALDRGVDQYVLLGAGLDTYACRRGGDLPPLVVFEVDHPATQVWKRARLAEAGLPVPSNLVFSPVDFERESLRAGLERARFDFGKPAVVGWLGVTPYLSQAAIMTTLAFVAGQLKRGSEIVFDYAEPFDGRDRDHQARLEALSARVAQAGEPFVSFFEPEALARDLRGAGFRELGDLDAAALNARYFGGRDDGLRIVGRGHCVHART